MTAAKDNKDNIKDLWEKKLKSEKRENALKAFSSKK